MSRRSASTVVEFPWGFGVVSDEYPTSVEHNRVVVQRDAEWSSVFVAAEVVLHDVPQRAVMWDVANVEASALASVSSRTGYELSIELLMTYAGPALTAVQCAERVPGDVLHESLIEAET